MVAGAAWLLPASITPGLLAGSLNRPCMSGARCHWPKWNNVDSKYIYFALHYEPERTTNPDGGEFHDQAIAIAKLRELVPDNIDIFLLLIFDLRNS